MFKKMFKNQRGLTLIELLAVVVILGIIAAIAIPAIGGMISNSKKDAHLANAEQIANSARIYIATNKLTVTSAGTTVTLEKLMTDGHLEEIKDPSASGSATYAKTSQVVAKKGTDGTVKFYITLTEDKTGGKTYLNSDTKDVKSLERGDVQNS